MRNRCPSATDVSPRHRDASLPHEDRTVLLGAALVAAALLGAAGPAQALNGQECTTEDASWFGYLSTTTGALRETTDADLLPALAPWRDGITCAWRDDDWASYATSPSHAVVFRDFAVRDVPDVMRAVTASGWDFDGIYTNSGLTLEDEDLQGLDGDALPESLVYIDAVAYPGSGDGWLWLRFDSDNWWGGSSWDEPTLVVEWWGGSAASLTGIADPSTFSTLPTIADAAPTPTQTAVIAGSAVVLMLAVGWPGYLLNAVIAARYDPVRDWVRVRVPKSLQRKKRARTARDASAAPTAAATAAIPPSSTDGPDAARRKLQGWVVWVGLAVAAIISCFVDPSFGLNAMSARLLVSAFIGFVAFNFGVLMLTRLVVGRIQPDAAPRLEFRWASLGLVLIAVVLARLLSFHPGIVFGLVAGLAFAASLTRARNALVTLLGAGFGLLAGAVGWTAYSLLAPVAGTNPVVLLLSETFAGITLEGVSALPIALLPLAALEGQKLFAWNRWVWAGAYCVGLAAFMLVLIGVPGGFDRIGGDYVRWVALFAAFAAVAVGAWALHTWLERRGARAREGAPSRALQDPPSMAPHAAPTSTPRTTTAAPTAEMG